MRAEGLRDHPTVKPTAMLEDALLDVTARGDIVIDPFLGSGSTLIAAERTGRRCRGVEIDPLYVDVIIRRFEADRTRRRVLVATGETFAALAAQRTEAASLGVCSCAKLTGWCRRLADIADRDLGCLQLVRF